MGGVELPIAVLGAAGVAGRDLAHTKVEKQVNQHRARKGGVREQQVRAKENDARDAGDQRDSSARNIN